MYSSNLINSFQQINHGLYKTLLARIPPYESSEYLEDIVNALMDAFSRGELKITLSHSSRPSQLKGTGWPEAHLKALLASGWLEGDSAPIVLENNQISWSRWHHEQNLVIKDLINRSNLIKGKSDFIQKEIHSVYFSNLNTEQKNAVDAICHRGVVLLSGGPGTGKTSTIIGILEKALSLNPKIRIGLSAPTGKASRRLKETIQKGLISINAPQREAISKIPCETLHRWLHLREGKFGRNKQNQLKSDLFVIDEMSMVDIVLMKGVLEALPKGSQLVLVGDPAQLPPIESGDIWNKLLEVGTLEAFGQGVIKLHRLYRNRGALALLGKTLREEGLKTFWSQVCDLPHSSNFTKREDEFGEIPSLIIQRLQTNSKLLKKLIHRLKIEDSESTEHNPSERRELENTSKKLFECLERLLILSPKRRGLWSVEHVNKTLLGNMLDDVFTNWPEGTPIMCGENQPELGLANGDIGITIGSKDNLRLVFRIFSEEQQLTTTFLHPARLRKIEPAFAMTIHKAQGSEANEVILLWPETPNQSSSSNTQENNHEARLLYTAITRAREKMHLITPQTDKS